MKLVTLKHQGSEYLGIQSADHVIIPALSTPKEGIPRSMLALISAGEEGLSMLREFEDPDSTGVRIALANAELLAPIPNPPDNVICLGWNYVEHIEESASAAVRDRELPEHPVVFTKAVGSIIGPFDPIPFDAGFSSQWDWEVELGVIIGKPGRGITEADALAHVFGYTVINDISIRDVQFRHQQFFLGKSADGACPMGPCVVTADEISDPQALDLRCRVNGETKQDSNTRYQIFDIRKTISILSKGMTLRAGDIIATGTPSGVGFARKPPEFLKPGDVVECEVEGIGFLSNPVVDMEDLG
ncbi:MAG: fumarylacetoacetate hydrolase family protein [Gammaproteobacteria bacterium]|nr:fumarylacetoacetate hydrolase family protein [Gammaproteobacteria bacterium]MDH3411500.1 fumarylacetoacetate hydrolase family protein [Gammaproteobacteria bacterium]